MLRVKTFLFEGELLRLIYQETTNVTKGVECDVYEFEGDKKKI